ncbi:MAG: energy-coupling factor ABC transporter permease [Betaproteobacteria bacterium]|nr:MAG: energy-coupling factor ABC transporter permease [Betaproteobacteria bacterium]
MSMVPFLFLSTIAIAVTVLALARAPWGQFRDTGFQHVFFGACVAVFFIWQLRVGILPAVPMHFLCLTTLTLMFGVPLAIIAAAILTGAMCVTGAEGWQSWPGSFLALGVVPILLTRLMLLASQRYLPPNPFIYIFVVAFFGAAAAMLAAMAVNSLLLLGLEQMSLLQLRQSYLSVLPLMMFPEAFINGLIVTGLVVFRPEWIPSFDDEVYLKS